MGGDDCFDNVIAEEIGMGGNLIPNITDEKYRKRMEKRKEVQTKGNKTKKQKQKNKSRNSKTKKSQAQIENNLHKSYLLVVFHTLG